MSRARTLANFVGGTSTIAGNPTFTGTVVGGSGKVLQVKQALSNVKATKSSASFVDSGLFTGVTFDSNLRSNSKVFATIEATIGEQNSGTWALPCELTLYEGSSNIGNNANSGICGSISVIYGNDGRDVYAMERVYGSILYSPSSTNPSYKLYIKSAVSAFNRVIGSSYSSGNSAYVTGGTRITLMEISA